MIDEEMVKEALDNTTGYKKFRVELKRNGTWMIAKEYEKSSTLKQEVANLEAAKLKTKSSLEFRVTVL